MKDQYQGVVDGIDDWTVRKEKESMVSALTDTKLFLPRFAPDLIAEYDQLLREIPGADAKALGVLRERLLKVKNRVLREMWSYVKQKRELQREGYAVGAFLRTFSRDAYEPALQARFEKLMKRLPEERVHAQEFAGELSPKGQDEVFDDVKKRLEEDGDYANDKAALEQVRRELAELKQKALDGVRGLLAKEKTGEDPKAKLAALQKRLGQWEDVADGVAFRGLTVSPDGKRLELKCQRREDCEKRLVHLPMEAEILLGTKFPVTYVPKDQDGATVLAGEDYGVLDRFTASTEFLDDLEAKAAAAAKTRDEKGATVTRSETALEAARAAAKAAEERARAAAAALEQRGRDFDRVWAEQEELKKKYEEAQAALKAAQDKANMDRIWSELLSNHSADGNITFAKGKSLLSDQGEKQLVLLGQMLAQRARETLARTGRRLTVSINGHTSRTGSKKTNDKLSGDRADAASARLKKYVGDAPIDFIAKGHGFDDLLPDIPPADEKQQRVEFQITDGLGEEPGSAEVAAARQWAESSRLQAEAGRGVRTALEAWKKAVAQGADMSQQLKAAQEEARAAAAAAPDAKTAVNRAQIAAARAKKAFETAAAASETAQGRVDDQGKVVDREALRAQGALLVSSSGPSNPGVSDPKTIAARVTAALTQTKANEGGFAGLAADLIKELFVGKDKDGHTLAQAVGELEQQSRGDVHWYSYLGGGQHWISAFLKRGTDVPGETARGATLVPEKWSPRPKPPEKPIEVEMVKPEDLPLSLRPKAPEEPAERADSPDAGAAEEAGQPDPRPRVPSAAPVADPRLAEAMKRVDEAALASKLDADRLAQANSAAERANAAIEGAKRRAAEAEKLARRRAALNRVVSNALGANGATNVVQEALFERGSAAITERGREKLDHLISRITAEFQGHALVIEGFASKEGGPRYDNKALSLQRARSVEAYLRAHCSVRLAYEAVGRGVTTERESDELDRFVRITVR